MPKISESIGEKTKSIADSIKDHQILDFKAQAARAEAVGDWKSAAKSYARGLEQRMVELALINSVQEGLSTNFETPSTRRW